MAKPNYAFAKRQRDLAKKQKKEEKLHRKVGTTDTPASEDLPQTDEPQTDQPQADQSPSSGDDKPDA